MFHGELPIEAVFFFSTDSHRGYPFFGTPPEPLRIANDGTEGVLPNSHGVVM